MFQPKELADIRQRAEKLASTQRTNRLWQHAYEELALAADHLETMMLRCILEKTDSTKDD